MTDDHGLSLIQALERASRRTRPFIIGGLLAIVAAFGAMAVYLYQQRSDADRRATEAEVRANRLEAAYKALEKGDRRQAQGLLLGVIQQERQIAAADPVAPPRPPQVALESLRVDIFHCENTFLPTQDWAWRTITSGPPNGRLRAEPRTLRSEVNVLPVYQLSRNEIRFNPEEEDAAERLRAEVHATTGAELAKVLTYYPTPGTISIFFCQGASPSPSAAPADKPRESLRH